MSPTRQRKAGALTHGFAALRTFGAAMFVASLLLSFSPEPAMNTQAPTKGPDTGPNGSMASEHHGADCEIGHQADGFEGADPGDIVVGAVRYLGAEYAADWVAPSDDDAAFYKMGALVDSNTAATGTVVATTATDAGIRVEDGPDAGSRSVTYDNCRAIPLLWVGGIVLHGDSSGCVTLEASTGPGSGAPQVQLRLGTDVCD